MLGNHGFTLVEAQTIALALVIMLVIGAVGAAWLIRKTPYRVAVATVLGVLAVTVWALRVSTENCVDDAVGVPGECSFFGKTIRTTPGD